MARTVGIGYQNFGELILDNAFYVDKTKFIKEWWEKKDRVTLITRPRRFGKTLTMSMLDWFFSISHECDSYLFEGLSIWEEEKYHDIQGTYPVINISFADIKDRDYDTAVNKICGIIQRLYIENYFLLDSDLLTDEDRKYFKKIAGDIKGADVAVSLRNLSGFLCRYYGKKVIILLDEYDTPMQEAYVGGYWDEIAEFMRTFFNSTFKTNPYLERAVITGVTRVSKESMFSDLNNMNIVSVTSDEYADSFGFTEKEVFAAMDEMELDDKDKVKKWYDGFIFGNVADIYNPWSIINYLSKKKIGLYWVNTSSNVLVSKLLQEGDVDLKMEFERLLVGETIVCELDEEIVFNMLGRNKNAVFSLLLASGYLKVLHAETYDEAAEAGRTRPGYKLDITNLEVRMMFEGLIADWFENGETDAYNVFVKALLLGDVKAMNKYMNRVAMRTFSYFDTGKNPSYSEPERFYHGFVLGLMVDLGNRYYITSNRESGFGRYDIMLEPKSKDGDGIIIEFKVHEPEDEKDLQATVNEALKQIEDKKYKQQLIEHGIKNIWMYGFAFEGKKVLIGKA